MFIIFQLPHTVDTICDDSVTIGVNLAQGDNYGEIGGFWYIEGDIYIQ